MTRPLAEENTSQLSLAEIAVKGDDGGEEEKGQGQPNLNDPEVRPREVAEQFLEGRRQFTRSNPKMDQFFQEPEEKRQAAED